MEKMVDGVFCFVFLVFFVMSVLHSLSGSLFGLHCFSFFS